MTDWHTKTVLTVIALSLLALTLRDTQTAQAQGTMDVRIVGIRSYGILGELPVTVKNRRLRVEVVD